MPVDITAVRHYLLAHKRDTKSNTTLGIQPVGVVGGICLLWECGKVFGGDFGHIHFGERKGDQKAALDELLD
jgi:hypothetical protein